MKAKVSVFVFVCLFIFLVVGCQGPYGPDGYNQYGYDVFGYDYDGYDKHHRDFWGRLRPIPATTTSVASKGGIEQKKQAPAMPTEKQQVKVTFLSDPPGGTLYRLNGDIYGPCPQVLWYDIDEEAVESGYLGVKGMIVRWPSCLERRSHELIRITVDGTDRQVTFVQPKEEQKAEYAEHLR